MSSICHSPLFVIPHCLPFSIVYHSPFLSFPIVCHAPLSTHWHSPWSAIRHACHSPLSLIPQCLSFSIVCDPHCLSFPIVCHTPLSYSHCISVTFSIIPRVHLHNLGHQSSPSMLWSQQTVMVSGKGVILKMKNMEGYTFFLE